MTALAWLMIITGITLLTAVVKGQVFDQNGRFALVDNMRELLTGVLSGNTERVEKVTGAEGGGYGENITTNGSAPPPDIVSQGAAPTGAGKYKLGAVKPHVANAANVIGSQFGIRTIYGYRAQGSVPGSLHPAGLALDLMVRGTTADQLAAYAVANHASFGITEVIWNRRIWTLRRQGEGWRKYSGPSPHTDHVHLSFANR